jgi:hypothetical protein
VLPRPLAQIGPERFTLPRRVGLRRTHEDAPAPRQCRVASILPLLPI